MSINSYSELYSFFIPFYHSPNLCKTFCQFISFSFAFENSRMVPSLFRYIVLACSGIQRSEEDFYTSSYNLIFWDYSFSFFFLYLRYFLPYIFSASLFFLRYYSSQPIYSPYIFMADKNYYASSPFLRPSAFLIPFYTRLLFLSYYIIISFSSTSGYPSDSEWILFRCLLSDQSEEEERLSLLNCISLSLM